MVDEGADAGRRARVGSWLTGWLWALPLAALWWAFCLVAEVPAALWLVGAPVVVGGGVVLLRRLSAGSGEGRDAG